MRNEERYRFSTADRPRFPKPWPTFTEDVKSISDSILISHYTSSNLSKHTKKKLRVRGKLQYGENGENLYIQGDTARCSLHEQTFYGAIKKNDEIKYVVRKSLDSLDPKDIDKIVDEEISIGDYVLTGGEIPAMVLIDSVARYVDGVIDNESTSEESFSKDGLLEYPQYTRPETFEGIKVPEVLQSGHHENINKWRRKEAIRVTYFKRPDLLEKANLTDEEKEYIKELKK